LINITTLEATTNCSFYLFIMDNTNMAEVRTSKTELTRLQCNILEFCVLIAFRGIRNFEITLLYNAGNNMAATQNLYKSFHLIAITNEPLKLGK
jgi:hypothetical protein